ncbi:Transcription factor TFIIIC tau55-related protein [Euphorbia peplus]|nr:Transcription factor TFIIIC tau55-related protein [Euphorbia peplus]
MEESDLSQQHNLEEEDEEEYVVLDLDAVSGQIDIPPNAPYVLSGLDTLNPILIIDDKLKLIGEYEETIGTCLVSLKMLHNLRFSESQPVVHEETGPSEANLFSGKFIIDPNQAPTKQVKPVARLHKILKFRLLVDDDVQDASLDNGVQDPAVDRDVQDASLDNGVQDPAVDHDVQDASVQGKL